jgi:hypothetical protein
VVKNCFQLDLADSKDLRFQTLQSVFVLVFNVSVEMETHVHFEMEWSQHPSLQLDGRLLVYPELVVRME